MKTALVCCLALLLCLAAPAFADIVTVQDGWTVVYHIDDETSGRRIPWGSYWIAFPESATYAVVYLLQAPPASDQRLGYLGEVVFPEGFPHISYECATVSLAPGIGLERSGCRALNIFVTPPPVVAQEPPATCGTRRPLGHTAVVVVGGLPEDSEIIGPFATPVLAQRFAQKNCQGDYSIEPLKR